MQGHTSKGEVDGEGPAWAPLRDNYMLTNSKLKDWDKMPVRTIFIYTMLNVTLVEGSSSLCVSITTHPIQLYLLLFFACRKQLQLMTLEGCQKIVVQMVINVSKLKKGH